MDFRELDDYIADIDQARIDYPSLKLFTGFECDYFKEFDSYYRDFLLGEKKIQYLTGSVHVYPYNGDLRGVHGQMMNEEMMKSIGVVFDKAQKVNGLSEYAITVELDSKKIGEKLLGRDLPERAARKAWYVTRQMNVISQRQEFFLHKIVTDEKEYRERTLVLQQEIDVYKEEVRLLLEGTEDGK